MSIFVPKLIGAIGSGSGERSIDRVTGDRIDRPDIHIITLIWWISVASESEVMAMSRGC